MVDACSGQMRKDDPIMPFSLPPPSWLSSGAHDVRSEEHTSELQSQSNIVCRLLLEKKNSGHVGERFHISTEKALLSEPVSPPPTLCIILFLIPITHS